MNFDGKTAESGKTTAMAKALYETASRDTLILHRHRLHHQGVDIPGKGIRYIQHSADQVAEGLSHGFLPILGVQWHPERLCAQVKKSEAVDGSLLLDAFLSLA